jgi:hypothetical protein
LRERKRHIKIPGDVELRIRICVLEIEFEASIDETLRRAAGAVARIF